MKTLRLTVKKKFFSLLKMAVSMFCFLSSCFLGAENSASASSQSFTAAECTKNVWSTQACTVTDLTSQISTTVGTNITSWTNLTASTSVVENIPQAYYTGSETCQFTDPNLISSNICSSFSIFNVTGSKVCFSGLFHSKVDYTTGTTPASMVVGDFNRDNKIDIAVSNSGSSTISVFISNGNGTFQNKVDYVTTTQPNHLITDDFNRDGKLDLVVVTGVTPRINFFPGVGDGTFGARVDTITSSNPIFITSGDFNRDGILDVFITRASGTVNLWTGSGTGSFPASFIIGTGTFGETRAGDFNRDGSIDVVSSISGAIATYTGTGTTAMGGPGFSVTCGALNSGLAVGDINHDGILDVVTTCGATFSINQGVGDGTYLAEVALAKESDSTPSILIVDFDLDGNLDLAYVGKNGNTLGLKRGNGDGTFQATQLYTTGTMPISVRSADFNNDGKPDFVTANQNSNSISLFIAK